LRGCYKHVRCILNSFLSFLSQAEKEAEAAAAMAEIDEQKAKLAAEKVCQTENCFVLYESAEQNFALLLSSD